MLQVILYFSYNYYLKKLLDRESFFLKIFNLLNSEDKDFTFIHEKNSFMFSILSKISFSITNIY